MPEENLSDLIRYLVPKNLTDEERTNLNIKEQAIFYIRNATAAQSCRTLGHLRGMSNIDQKIQMSAKGKREQAVVTVAASMREEQTRKEGILPIMKTLDDYRRRTQ